MVSAWTSEQNIVLGQVKTQEKSNEITAIPELLEYSRWEVQLLPLTLWDAREKSPQQL